MTVLWGHARAKAWAASGYPPTHLYDADKLEPFGPLRDRLEIIGREFPEFFHGDRLLDVGCSGGFFSIRMQGFFGNVVGIDTDPDAIMAANTIRQGHGIGNVRFEHVGFRAFHSARRFDRIFVGNGPHHLFTEASCTHDWVAKLAALSCGMVLLEGPRDTTCKDLAADPKRWPKAYDGLYQAMGAHFNRVSVAPTTSYTPDREFTLWRRKAPLVGERTIRKRFRHDDCCDNDEVTVGVAALSPVSNGLQCFVEDGWLEDREDDSPFRYFENEPGCFLLHCVNQVFLARCGYVDIDPAGINVWRGSKQIFDKSGIIPVASMTQKHADVWLALLRQSYKTVPKVIVDSIYAALSTRDSVKIEAAFRGTTWT